MSPVQWLAFAGVLAQCAEDVADAISSHDPDAIDEAVTEATERIGRVLGAHLDARLASSIGDVVTLLATRVMDRQPRRVSTRRAILDATRGRPHALLASLGVSL